MVFGGRYGIGAVGFGLLALASGCVASSDGTVSEQASKLEAPEFDPFLSIGQNTTWTVKRGAAQTLRVVAYGDSIFAGYQGAFSQVARRSAPYVAGEYLALAWNANVQVVRRAETGGLASEVYSRITSDKSYMEDPSTRAVYFEMCGNDYLQARRAFQGSGGTCSLSGLQDALAACVDNTQKAMQQINTSAQTAITKAVANLYYPGFDKDNVSASCTDPATGQRANVQQTLLPLMARSNWRVCDIARRNGFACVDSFAEFMGADYDTNGDGMVDSDALRIDPSESEDAYVTRISVTLRSTLRDANHHGVAASSQTGYLYSDDIHPNVYLEMIQTNANGSSAPDFPDAQIAGGKNPKWNLFGHERMGWALANAAAH
jgi:lysophospholipase L1-like esterase